MIELQTKPDLPKALERFEAWWECEIIDRPPVTLHVPAEHAPRKPVPSKTHATLRERWLDVEYVVDRFEASLDGQVFLAESFPQLWANVGPEACATLYGCELEFGESTSWSEPVAGNCREILDIQPSFENVYWQTLRDITDLSLQRGAGKWITGIPDIHMDGDLLAALRDPQNLCLDLADDIASVRAACDYTNKFYPTMFDDMWGRLAAAGMPATTWAPFLHDGRAYVTSCDLICMISPDMFARTILPAIQEQMAWLERNIFHLDGPGALKHLDALLACEDLDAVQWVYGAGNEPAGEWIDVYKRIQAAGKGMQVVACTVEQAKTVARELRPEGVWFSPVSVASRAEGEAFLKWLGRWAAGKE